MPSVSNYGGRNSSMQNAVSTQSNMAISFPISAVQMDRIETFQQLGRMPLGGQPLWSLVNQSIHAVQLDNSNMKLSSDTIGQSPHTSMNLSNSKKLTSLLSLPPPSMLITSSKSTTVEKNPNLYQQQQRNNLNYLLLMPTGSFGAEATNGTSNDMTDSIMNVPSNETKIRLVKTLNEHPMLKSFLAGSLSGTCSTLLFQPFDLLKTRVQSANFSLTPTAHSARIGGIIVDVVKNEQIFGLWRGTVPSLMRCVPGVGLHFCCLDTLQNHFCANRQPTAIQAFAFGMTSRSIAGFLLIPVTVVKTRFESGIFAYKTITDAVRQTYQHEGIRGLTSGLSATLMRDVPFSGLYYMFYTQSKNVVLPFHEKHFLNESKSSKRPISSSNIISTSCVTFMCGLNAGLMASAVTQPMDVVKTHMQLYPKQFPTFLPTVIMIVKQKGLNGLFSGLVPRMVRRTLVASMAWTVYEQMMKNIGLK